MSSTPSPPTRRRHAWRAVLVFVVLAVALFLLVPRLAGEKHTIGLVREASLPLLIAAIVAESVSLVFYSLLFRRLMGLLQHPVTLALALRINLAGLAAAHLLSAGGVGGAAVTYRVLQKRGMRHSLVLIAVIFQNAFAYSVLFALFGVGLVTLMFRGQANDFGVVVATIVVVALIVLAGYGLWLLYHPSALRRRARQISDWLGRHSKRLNVSHQLLDEWLDGVVDGWRRLRRDGRRHIRTFGHATGYWGLDITCLVGVVLAFHQWLAVPYLLIAYAVANVVGTFSPTPGGLGAVEGVMIALLAGFGLGSSAAIAIVLVYRLINFWLPVPLGLGTYLSLR
jgi:uncharacterized protein (TIRG00374 family)